MLHDTKGTFARTVTFSFCACRQVLFTLRESKFERARADLTRCEVLDVALVGLGGRLTAGETLRFELALNPVPGVPIEATVK